MLCRRCFNFGKQKLFERIKTCEIQKVIKYFILQMYWAGALHLYTPLPFRPGCGGFGELFRTHFFVNAGNIGNWAEEGIKEL